MITLHLLRQTDAGVTHWREKNLTIHVLVSAGKALGDQG